MALAILSLHYLLEKQSIGLTEKRMENSILRVPDNLVALPTQKMSKKQCLNLGETNYCEISRQERERKEFLCVVFSLIALFNLTIVIYEYG